MNFDQKHKLLYSAIDELYSLYVLASKIETNCSIMNSLSNEELINISYAIEEMQKTTIKTKKLLEGLCVEIIEKL
jgi:hypothetical protein